jgi:hypothetical protein
MLNTFLFFLFAVIALVILIISVPYYGRVLSQEGKSFFYEKSPDLIAVYTGDAGRIEKSLKTSKKHPSAKLLISGVYSKNNLMTLLRKFDDQKGRSSDYFDSIIELDYQSQNTIENVIMTLEFLRQYKNYKSILIISSDYHLPRIQLLVKMLQREDDNFDIHFESVESQILNQRSITLYAKEFAKIFKTILYYFFPSTNESSS